MLFESPLIRETFEAAFPGAFEAAIYVVHLADWFDNMVSCHLGTPKSRRFVQRIFREDQDVSQCAQLNFWCRMRITDSVWLLRITPSSDSVAHSSLFSSQMSLFFFATWNQLLCFLCWDLIVESFKALIPAELAFRQMFHHKMNLKVHQQEESSLQIAQVDLTKNSSYSSEDSSGSK